MAGDQEFPSRSFLLYWRANAVSAFGTYITLLALQTLVVLTLHGSAAEVGWLNSARWLPYLVVGVVVGALVDRHPRRPILVITDLVQAGLLVTIPLLWWIHRLSFPGLLVVVMAYGTASVINGAAAMSLLPRLVQRGDLQRAHARGDGADAVAMSAGPALGGLLVSAVGAPAAVPRGRRDGPRHTRTVTAAPGRVETSAARPSSTSSATATRASFSATERHVSGRNS